MPFQLDPYSYFERGMEPRYPRAHNNELVQCGHWIDEKLEEMIHALVKSDFDQYVSIGESIYARDDYLINIAREAVKVDSSFTDLHRVSTARTLMIEKTILTYLFEYCMNDEISTTMRAQHIDGIRGVFVDGIDAGFTAANILGDTASPRMLGEIRGSLQEDTVNALFNYHEDPDFVALPATTEEDLSQATDTIVYWINDGHVQKYAVSIKSSPSAAQIEKEENPHLIVLSSDIFHNMDLQISRTLQAQAAGHPGITLVEHDAILDAKKSLFEEFYRQAQSVKSLEIATLYSANTAHLENLDGVA